MKRHDSGFTLIELVMVIVILGILAAFALPRFADLGGDARRAAVQGIGSNLKSAAAIVHSQALVSNLANAAAGTVTLEGQAIAIKYGYPTITSIKIAGQFTPANTDYTETQDTSATPNTITWERVGAVTPANCSVVYSESTSTVPADVTSDPSGC